MSSHILIDLNRHYATGLIMMRYLKMTSNQDWRYDEERLKLRAQCIRVLLAKLGTVKIDKKASYSTQNIYECADTWVSQGSFIHQWSCSLFQRLLQG